MKHLLYSLKLTASLPPENRPFYPIGKEKVFQPSIFRGELLVSGRVHNFSISMTDPWGVGVFYLHEYHKHEAFM